MTTEIKITLLQKTKVYLSPNDYKKQLDDKKTRQHVLEHYFSTDKLCVTVFAVLSLNANVYWSMHLE